MKIIDKVLGIPKTLYFNFYYLPIKDAIKLPILVSHRVKIINMGRRNSLLLHKIKYGVIRIGTFGSFSIEERTPFYWNIKKNGIIEFAEEGGFGWGTSLDVGGKIYIGKKFNCNAGCIISIKKGLNIGDDCIFGWRCTIIDGDGHVIRSEGKMNEPHAIEIGNKVWISASCNILKGSIIQDNTVVALGSTISGKVVTGNCVIGDKGKLLKDNISWER